MKLRLFDPKTLYMFIQRLAKFPAKQKIAKAFNIKSIQDSALPLDYSFADYVQDLYTSNNPKHQFIQMPHQSCSLVIDADEVDDAINRLGHKATGEDGMTSYFVKNRALRELLVSKLTIKFNHWANNRQIPMYLKSTRLIMFSKVANSEYPPVGACRSIAIANSTTKVYEMILHKKLQQQLQKHKVIHPT